MNASRGIRLALGLALIVLGADGLRRALRRGALDGDGTAPVSNRVATDLLSDWRRAEVYSDTHVIEFGAPSAARHYHEPDPRQHGEANGILSRDFGNGMHAGFACGDEVRVRFDRLRRGSVKVILDAMGIPNQAELSATSAPDQVVTVTLGAASTPITEFELDGEERARRIEFTLPAEHLVRGVNELVFAFSRTVARSFEGVPAKLPYAATFLRMEFVPLGSTPGPEPPTTLAIEEVAGVGSRPPREALVFSEGTRVVLPVRLDGGRPRLVGSLFVHPSDGAPQRSVQLFARYRTAGDAMQLVAKGVLDAEPGNPRNRKALDVDCDLSTYGDTEGVIEIETESPPAGQAPLRIAFAAPAIRGGDRPEPATEPPKAEFEHMQEVLHGSNVVILLLDAASARFFTAYGATKEITPNISAFARDGVVFESVFSPSSYTLPAVGSLFTGLLPDTHGVTESGSETERRRLAPTTRTLAERFKSAGYRTLAFISNPNAGPEPGFDRGFDVFEKLYAEPELWNEGVLPEALNERVMRHVGSGLDQPFFLYAHYFPPHAPYRAPTNYREGIVDGGYAGRADGSRESIESFRHRGEPYSERDFTHLEQLYAANLRYVDDQVMNLLRSLDQAGLTDRTLFMIVADHGEAFGEHGNLEHGDTVFGEEVVVPWFLRFPPSCPFPPRRVPGPTSLLDVAPTLLSLLDLPFEPGEFDGIDLSGRLIPREFELVIPERSLVSRSVGFKPRYVIHRLGLAYHFDTWTREEFLFDLSDDPAESKPLPTAGNPLAEYLRLELCRTLCRERQLGESLTLSPEELARQAEIGYVTRGAGAPAEHAAGCPLLRR